MQILKSIFKSNIMKKLSLLFILSFSALSLNAQSQIDTSLVVNGVCGMCQNTIEKAAKLEGVEKASWDKNTKILKVSFDSQKVDLEKIYKSVAASGYDTEYLAAPDEAYNSLHSCCMYRDPQTHEDHKGHQKKK